MQKNPLKLSVKKVFDDYQEILITIPYHFIKLFVYWLFIKVCLV